MKYILEFIKAIAAYIFVLVLCLLSGNAEAITTCFVFPILLFKVFSVILPLSAIIYLAFRFIIGPTLMWAKKR